MCYAEGTPGSGLFLTAHPPDPLGIHLSSHPSRLLQGLATQRSRRLRIEYTASLRSDLEK